MKVKLQVIYKISLAGLVATYLAACQGSNLGGDLEVAIAPSKSPTPEAIAEKPEQPKPIATITTTPTATPEPTVTPTPNSDPTQIQAIALPSFPKTPTTEKISLKALFYINFANPQVQADEFSDLETAPAALRSWIKDLNKLGTIAPKTDRQFQPNILVARREYARWLLQTNNRLYKNQPSRQIRLAQLNDAASFADIPSNHPDFAIIQGLANAGLITGTGDRFRPNDPLLREELVQWKIPLDLRQPLPSATLESINQVWGFKDSDRISENALSAIFADAQLRDLANIRRSFGFTTIFQPQKPVTRAEAAASLWYFGTATDGLSASKALELDR
ncbi:MAG: S-layer homology domain-containing protein [Pseudanabaena sp. CAN_BIN31]|nr:S-layer homology domain-containing protein [Pseudanabaena sp. CAN_BIN31]